MISAPDINCSTERRRRDMIQPGVSAANPGIEMIKPDFEPWKGDMKSFEKINQNLMD